MRKHLQLGQVSEKLPGFRNFMVKAAGENARSIAVIRLLEIGLFLAEIHWYEANGIGKKEFKIKRLLREVSEGHDETKP